ALRSATKTGCRSSNPNPGYTKFCTPSVLQSQEHVAGIRSLHKNLIGIEMESYSVFTAAEYSSSPKPKCFSIKAVCDFGDDQKDDDFHDYAAFMSARVLFDFCLEKIDPINEELD
ncbi:hypothetical protein N0018_25790, partial [Pseudomonas aeruginosa]|nr:hypothetical protein [Pseudomonas aeruginosa]